MTTLLRNRLDCTTGHVRQAIVRVYRWDMSQWETADVRVISCSRPAMGHCKLRVSTRLDHY